MGILKVMGALMLVGFGTTMALFFRKTAPGVWRENAWEELRKSFPEKHSFKLFGDCGTPESLSKYFSPAHISGNAVMGVVKDGVMCDVLDMSLSDGREMDSPRANGFILQVTKPYLKEKDMPRGGKLTGTSQNGEYIVVDAPNKNYVYIVIVDKRFHPVVYESIEWYNAMELKEIILNNLDVVYEYMDKFCASQVAS